MKSYNFIPLTRLWVFFIATIVIILFSSCHKEDTPLDYITDPPVSLESIIKETGCHPINPETIQKYTLAIDEKNNVKYLYGSKKIDNIGVFWVSKFTNEGKYIWETLIKEVPSSWAEDFHILNNGNILLANTSGDLLFPLNRFPVIVSPQNGNAKSIKVFDRYIYTDVFMCPDFFFCVINNNATALNPNAKLWCLQIDNQGNIIRQDEKFNIPKGETTLITNDSTYIEITDKFIKRKSVLVNSLSEWSHNVNLPSYQSCEMSLSLIDKEVTATYKLNINGKDSTKIYRLSYLTGEPIIDLVNIKIIPPKGELYVGKEYKLDLILTPENAFTENIIWESSNTDIATVNEEGVIKCLTEGSCTITATTIDGKCMSTCNINIVKQIIELSKSSVALILGGYVTGPAHYFISNVSDDNIVIYDLYIIDSLTNRIIAKLDSPEPVHISPSQELTFDVYFNSVYLPKLFIEYKHKGITYQKYLPWE